jgi:hypothetical protein
MRNTICCLLVMLFGSWSSSLGQKAPQFTTPQIVATFERVNKTGPIPLTTLYAPPGSGMFRVSIVAVVTVGNGGGNGGWQPIIRATDAAGQYEQDGSAVSTNVPGTATTEFLVRAQPRTHLRFSVRSVGPTSGSKYNVWVVVEPLM